MGLQRRQFLAIPLLSIFSFNVKSSGPLPLIIEKIHYKSGGGDTVSIFLDKIYGKNTWEYDNLNLNIKFSKNSARFNFPVTVSCENSSLAKSLIKLTIYLKEYTAVLVPYGSYTYINKEPIKVATFYFYNNAIPYISTRIRVSWTREASIFCVFESKDKDIIKVI